MSNQKFCYAGYTYFVLSCNREGLCWRISFTNLIKVAAIDQSYPIFSIVMWRVSKENNHAESNILYFFILCNFQWPTWFEGLNLSVV